MTSSSGEMDAGSHIGDYILEARLGGGSFGTVWRARHASSGRPVAVKLLTGVLAGRDRTDMRAEVELLAATASSKSPHVVRVLGGGTEPLPYVVMEYIEGSDLAALLKERGKLPPQETIGIGLAVADALHVLKEAGIIHRDVKPANVMLDREGTVKLADFGIAKIVGYETITMTGQLPMTMAYAAPEVWEGSCSHQSDLYALGVVLYQCLVGAPPFTGNYGALYRQHTSVPPDLGALPEETPSSLRELIRLCLEKEPQARPEDASECLELLQKAESELAEAAYASAVREPVRFGPWLRREPHPEQPWAWLCTHEATGEEATVEVHFAHDLAYGEELRRAVAANPRLVPLGAERLLGTNRLLLRPGEGWHEPPGGEFSFWVARDEQPAQEPTAVVTLAMLGRAVEGLLGLIDAAAASGVSLSLAAGYVDLLPDGSVHVRRPGLPPAGDGSPAEQALAYVRGLSLEEEARAPVASAQDLRGLGALLTKVPEAPAGPPELGVAHPAEGTGLFGQRKTEEETTTFFPATATVADVAEPVPTAAGVSGVEATRREPPLPVDGAGAPPRHPPKLAGLPWFPPPYRFALVGMLAAAVLVAAIVAAVYAFGGGPNKPRVIGDFYTLTVEPTRTPVPPATATPTPLPSLPSSAPITNRMNCDAIRGTEYLSAEERDWFLSTCLSPTPATPEPAPTETACPTPAYSLLKPGCVIGAAKCYQGTRGCLSVGAPEVQGRTVTIGAGESLYSGGHFISEPDYDWGDGTSIRAWGFVTHTYSADGTYTVTVTAYDDLGVFAVATVPVTIASGSVPELPPTETPTPVPPGPATQPGVNLVANPSFETGTGAPDGWTMQNDFEWPASPAHSGSASLRTVSVVQCGSSGSIGGTIAVSNLIPIDPSRRYLLTLWAQGQPTSPGHGPSLYVGLKVFDSSGAEFPFEYGLGGGTARRMQASWGQVAVSFGPPGSGSDEPWPVGAASVKVWIIDYSYWTELEGANPPCIAGRTLQGLVDDVSFVLSP